MTVADNLRALVSELRPLIDERLDIDERISEIRGPASDKGLDFSQAKSLVVALARDSRDGGERVAKLTAKADNASWYADMLKSPTVAETSNNSPQSAAKESTQVAIENRVNLADMARINERTLANQAALQSPPQSVTSPVDPSDMVAGNSEIEGAAPAGPHLNGRIESDRKTDFSAPSNLPDDGDVRGSPFDRNRVEA